MEGMIGIREQPQGCARAKPLDESPEQLLVGELVAVSLQKQHRHVDLEQMAAAIIRRPSGRMQRESKEGQAPDSRQGRCSLRIEPGLNADGVWPWVDSLEGILGLVTVGVVELHPWSAAVDDIEHPDTLVFDLEPGEGIPWQFVVETALRMRELLRTEGLESWPKLTGGTGVHVMVPVEPELDWKEARAYSHEITERIATAAPDRYLTSAAREGTAGRLVVDGRGTTAVGAYSPRARPGFPIAAPLSFVARR